MKSILLFLGIIAFAASPLVTVNSYADKSVKGYTKKDGTYVEPHHKTDPNTRKDDNFSSKGNTNPYTGKKGYVDPYKETTPKKKKD
jgi:hypothetical protein